MGILASLEVLAVACTTGTVRPTSGLLASGASCGFTADDVAAHAGASTRTLAAGTCLATANASAITASAAAFAVPSAASVCSISTIATAALASAGRGTISFAAISPSVADGSAPSLAGSLPIAAARTAIAVVALAARYYRLLAVAGPAVPATPAGG